MFSSQFAVIFTFFSLPFSQGLSSLNDTIDASTCVAPKEYQICYDLAVLTSAKCVEDAGDAIQVLGCGCADFQEQITCILNACWNRVYGCEYQVLVANFLSMCDVATQPIPYWPAPADSPGACSCNTGLIVQAILNSTAQAGICYEKGNSTIAECDCCAKSVQISAFYDICPATDPTLLGITAYTNASSIWSSCLTSPNPLTSPESLCPSLGFLPPLSTGALYNPTNLPTPGTQGVSNLPGEVTSPASGAVFTWSEFGGEATVTALSLGAVVTAGTSGSSATGTGATTSKATGTQNSSPRRGPSNSAILAVVAVIVGYLQSNM